MTIDQINRIKQSIIETQDWLDKLNKINWFGNIPEEKKRDENKEFCIKHIAKLNSMLEGA